MIYTCGSTGQSITLGKEIASGGEGIVWQSDRNGYVAKIYKTLPKLEHVQKLEVMVAHPPREPNSHLNHISFAWPKSLLKDANGNCVGFLMPAIANAKQLIDVYNPQRRKQQKLEVDWRFLHTTALNIASIIQAIHAEGYVMGDIKPANILVNNRALPSIIDTDSFQVRNLITNKIYRCGVGSEGFTPPELIGKDFSTIDQTQVHDRFRIALIIYHLLFGETPFKGNYIGTGDASEEPEERIRRGLWLYEPNNLIQPVANTIPLNILHPEVQQCFLKCFNNGHTQPNLRPSAGDWVKALKIAVNELTVCGKFDSHYYSRTYGNCYWCKRASKFKVDIFPGVEKPQPQSSVAAPTTQSNNQNTNQVNTQFAQSSNITPTANTNQVNAQVAQYFNSERQNSNPGFLLGLVISNFCIVGFTYLHYIVTGGFLNFISVIIWSLLALVSGMIVALPDRLKLSSISRVNLAISVPTLGVINCFINPESFLAGWWLVFLIGFIVMIISLSQNTAKTNSTSKVSPNPALTETIKVFTLIFVLGSALYTYSTLVVPFDTTAFTRVVLQEDFNNPNIDDWFISENAEIKNEALFQLVVDRNISRWSTWKKNEYLKDVDFSADVIKVGGPNNPQFGLVAREKECEFYYLLINGEGYIEFGKIESKNWIMKVSDIHNVNLGNSTNRLRIVCNGNRIIGYVNDKIIGSFEDDSRSDGEIGFISSGGETEGVAVQFDNVLVKVKENN
ncbi:protein kinase domain-containing protein [Tolypothrix sp. VBCCA 56010]|uniref:protein kinase domain-containing protein n=1 Tax=Tolypothrix sp. VBCCA 56010 TaxID=3137731 RepID=UPI003D7C9BB8